MDFLNFRDNIEKEDMIDDYETLREIDWEYYELTDETIADLIEYMKHSHWIIFKPNKNGGYKVVVMNEEDI